MRLTLRTLLAYLEDVLEPQDREDLQKQIEESDNAGELIHRMRDVMQRIRLGSPEVHGKDAVDNPNTMAEYLDNTLPDGNVADFERACLESDMMLAEAAACQHTIAMALGESVTIDPDTRRRLYELPDMLADLEQAKAEQTKVEQAKAVAATESQAPTDTDESDTSEVPEYLRSQGSIPWTAWLMATAALVLLGMTLFLISNGPVEEPVADSGNQVAEGAGTDEVESTGTDSTGSGEEEVTPGEETDLSEETNTTTPDQSTEVDSGGPSVGDSEIGASEDVVEEGTTDTTVQEPIPSTDGSGEAKPDSPMTTTTSDPASGQTEEGLAGETTTAGDSSEVDSSETSTLEAPELTSIGVAVNADKTLLVVESDPGAWTRIGSDEELDKTAQLLSLPTYRNVVQLANGLRLELVGLTKVEVSESPTEAATPRADLSYGRMLVVNPDSDSSLDCEIVVAGSVGRATLQPGAMVGVMAYRSYKPGSDVFNQSPPLDTIAYAPKGKVAWIAGADRYEFGSSRQWGITSEGDLTNLRDYQGDSGWIEGVRLSPWDDQASPYLPEIVSVGEETWPQLMEVLEGNEFKEVRALAARCSAAVGHPDPLVASLGDESQSMIWRDNIRELRELASRGTIEASNVRRVMIEQNGEGIGGDLFSLLRGFDEDVIGRTDEEVQAGALVQVLEWLESESLAIRVLATMNLEEISGRSDIFDPTDSATRRRQALRKLRKQLRDNDLRITEF